MISHSKGSLCRVQELELDNDDPSDHTKELIETYAKMALLLFLPFQK